MKEMLVRTSCRSSSYWLSPMFSASHLRSALSFFFVVCWPADVSPALIFRRVRFWPALVSSCRGSRERLSVSVGSLHSGVQQKDEEHRHCDGMIQSRDSSGVETMKQTCFRLNPFPSVWGVPGAPPGAASLPFVARVCRTMSSSVVSETPMSAFSALTRNKSVWSTRFWNAGARFGLEDKLPRLITSLPSRVRRAEFMILWN